MMRILVATFVVLACATAQAEVKSSSQFGFGLGGVEKVKAPADKVYAALIDIGGWWDPDHSYSGEAKNLYLETKPHGWFGERLPNGGFVKHMEVAYLAPGRTLRLLGGLGPLQEMGLNGALTFKIKADGDAAQIAWSYNVSGHSSMDLKKLAPVVNGVLEGQVKRLIEKCR